MTDSWHLFLETAPGTYSVRIQEISAPGGKRIEYRYRLERRTRAGWLEACQYEFISTGILELVIDGPGMAYGGTRFHGAATVPLEAKLPRVFRKIEVHRLDAELREEERKREAAERERRREAAMAEARLRYDEQARWEDFQQRSRGWEDVVRHRAFLAAARAAADAYQGPDRHDLVAHLDFAQRNVDAIDPLREPQRTPARGTGAHAGGSQAVPGRLESPSSDSGGW